MTTGTPVDVLIVTLCKAERADAIRRAVATTLAQEGVSAHLTMVVNGQRFDPDLLAWLRQEPGVTVLYQEAPSIFLARRRAREAVTAPYFAFLDDDDYLLPGGLRARVAALDAEPAADAVVANGFLSDGAKDVPMLEDIEQIRRDPLLAIMETNWLATASTMFRTRTIPADYFDVTIRSNDMTYLAFRLALEKKVIFIPDFTYRKTYSADSISLTDDWNVLGLATLDAMLRFPMPPAARRRLLRKCTLMAHDISDVYRRRGELGPAWRFHLRSLQDPWGCFHYAMYTRHLLRASGSGDAGASPLGPATAPPRQ